MNLWRTKIIAKLILSRLPFGHKLWSKIGLFRHGAMDDYSYAWKVLNIHTKLLDDKINWVGLELGPGDGLLSAILAHALGAKSLTLIDSGDYAHRNTIRYQKQIQHFLLAYPNATLPKINYENGINNMLASVSSNYHTKGLSSLQMLNGSYDLIFSQAVLEHVRHVDFRNTLLECYRLLSPDGIMSHVIDFKDHLGGMLNNMRFPSLIWEKEWFASGSNFYTNRIKLQEMITICEDIGFKVEIVNLERWDFLPIKRKYLANEFRNLTDEDLKVSCAHLVMRLK